MIGLNKVQQSSELVKEQNGKRDPKKPIKPDSYVKPLWYSLPYQSPHVLIAYTFLFLSGLD